MLTETTAELAAALTLAAARRVVEGDRFMRGGMYKGWLPNLFVGSLLQARPLCGHPSPGSMRLGAILGIIILTQSLGCHSGHHLPSRNRLGAAKPAC